MRILFSAAVVSALLAAPLAIATPAIAADEPGAVTWSVTPSDEAGPDGRSWMELEIDPGETITEHLAVRNVGATDAVFALSAADGYFTETGRFNMLQSGQKSVAAGTWIEVDAAVTVAAGETAIVPFTITVPENATPGDHPAGIAASVDTVGTTSDGTQVGVESRVGFRVITRVGGQLAPALSISGVSGEFAPSWNLFAPGTLSVTYTATNDGNTELAFDDTILGARADRGNLYPGETRTVTVDGVDAWPVGVLSVPVTVEAAVPSDDTLVAPVAETTITVWAPPWLHLAAIALLALIVTAIVIVRRRSTAALNRRLDEARAEGRREQVLSR